MKKQVVLDVVCPVCQRSLMNEEVKINGLPSVKLNIRSEENERGTVYLCATYECFEHHKDMAVAQGEIVEFCCPFCHSELLTRETCRICDAPMVKLGLQSGGFIKICSRFGCFNHYLSLSDLEAEHQRSPVQ